MLTEQEKRALAERVGPTVAPAIHELNKVMARYLATGDIPAFVFVVECVSAAVGHAFDLCKGIQDESKAQQVH